MKFKGVLSATELSTGSVGECVQLCLTVLHG